MKYYNNSFVCIFYKKLNIGKFWDGKMDYLVNGNDHIPSTILIDGIIYGSTLLLESINASTVPGAESLPNGEYSCIYTTDNYVISFTDPLGADHIYFFEDSNFILISNDITIITKKLNELGCNLSIDMEAFSSSLLIGISFYPGTGFKEIMLLNPWEYIFFDRNLGKLNIREREFWNFIDNILYDKISYEEMISLTTKRLRLHVLEALNQPGIPILELTGGKDSRIVLSALLSWGNKNFSVFTHGGRDSFDIKFSQFICNIFGLKNISFSNELNIENASLKYNLHLAGCLRTMDLGFFSIGKNKEPYFLLSGMYGELCRSYFAKQVFLKKCNANIEQYSNFDDINIFKELLSTFAWKNFASDDLIETQVMRSVTAYSHLPGRHLKMLLDHAYTFSRARWHFGHQMKHRRHNFIKTYSICNDFYFYATAFCNTFEERINDKNIHYLLNELYPPLCFFPHEIPPYYIDRSYKHSDSLSLIQLPEYLEYPYNKGVINDSRIKEDSNDIPKDIESFIFDFLLSDNMKEYINYKNIIKIKNSKNKINIYLKFYPLICWCNTVFKMNRDRILFLK